MATVVVAGITAVVAARSARHDRKAEETVAELTAHDNLVNNLQEQVAAAEQRRLADLEHYSQQITLERAESTRHRARAATMARQLRTLGHEPEEPEK